MQAPEIIDGRYFRNDMHNSYRNGKRIRTRKIRKFHRLWFQFQRYLEQKYK